MWALMQIKIDAEEFWCSNQADVWVQVSYCVPESAENCTDCIQGHVSYCTLICLFLTLYEGTLFLKFIVSNPWFRKKNIREILYNIKGLPIWLHNSVHANKSHRSSCTSMLLRSAVEWEMILDYMFSVKEGREK